MKTIISRMLYRNILTYYFALIVGISTKFWLHKQKTHVLRKILGEKSSVIDLVHVNKDSSILLLNLEEFGVVNAEVTNPNLYCLPQTQLVF